MIVEPTLSSAPNSFRHVAPRVDGALHSCFTAGIAELMSHFGIEHTAVFGSQLFLALRLTNGGWPLTWVHYHTPILGRHRTHVLIAQRRCAEQIADAVPAIARECGTRGVVLVAGSTSRLPWLVTLGQRQAPHWFVIDALDLATHRTSVRDPFEYIDESGVQPRSFCTLQEPNFDWLGATSERAVTYENSEQWAFAEPESVRPLPLGGGQWFELEEVSANPVLTLEEWRQAFCTTLAFHGGERRRADLEGEGWVQGLAALEFLARAFDERRDDPQLYLSRNDIWVAARARSAIAVTLREVAENFSVPSFAALADWVEANLVTAWAALPRLFRYNTAQLQRGKKASPLLGDAMQKVLSEEVAFLSKLRATVHAPRLV